MAWTGGVGLIEIGSFIWHRDRRRGGDRPIGGWKE